MAIVFVGVKACDATALVNLVNSANHDKLLKTCKKDVLIPRGQSVKVTCRVNTGPLDKPTPVLFEADENNQWSTSFRYIINGKYGQI